MKWSTWHGWFIVWLLLLGGTLLAFWVSRPSSTLQRAQKQLQAYVSEEVHQLEARAKGSMRGQAAAVNDPQSFLYWLQEDSLVAWQGPTATPLPPLSIPARTGVIDLPPGLFYGIELECEAPLKAFGLVPLYFRGPVESPFTTGRFPEKLDLPSRVVLTEASTAFPLHLPGAEQAVFLDISGAGSSGIFHLLFVLQLLLSLGILVRFLHQASLRWMRQRGPLWGIGFLLLSALLLRQLLLEVQWSTFFPTVPVLVQLFEIPVLNGSLGGLLLNSVLVLWLMLFTYRALPFWDFPAPPPIAGFLMNTLQYGGMLAGLWLLAKVFQLMVVYSEIPFDFENVFNLDGVSLLAILCMLILLFAVFLFCHRLALTARQIEARLSWRLFGMGLAMGIFSMLIIAFSHSTSWFLLLFWAGLFVLVLDFFLDAEGSGLTWLILWLIFFAGFTAFFIFQYNKEKVRNELYSYAQVLAMEKDALLIAQLRDIQTRAEKASWPLDSLKKALRENSYLLNNYTWLLAPDSLGRGAVQDTVAVLATGKYTLLLDLAADRYRLVLQPQLGRKNPAIRALALEAPYRGLPAIEKFEFARYHRQNLLESNRPGTFPKKQFALEWIGREKVAWNSSDPDQIELYYALGDHSVLIRKSTGGFIKPLSLFSFLFSLLFLLSPVLAFFNSRFHWLPDSLHFTIPRHPTLAAKVQIGILAVILLSFVLIGWLTSWYFQQSDLLNQEVQTNRRLNSILERLAPIATDTASASLKAELEALSQIHELELYYYDLAGRSLLATDTILPQLQLVSRYLPNGVLAQLRQQEQQVIRTAKLGTLSHLRIYRPVEQVGGKTVAYLAVPFFAEIQKTQTRTADFIASLVNVYVFLLLVASTIAIAVANSITRPLRDLGERLSGLRLGKNEPLQWESQDELGTLIDAYNQMLIKLEESTNKLAQSERESAWREMAKQVAHEIKNPLTPMKLSIQYLQHAYQSQPDRVDALIKQVSGTLVEQIDALSKIASEFSAFAKMPKATMERLNISQLLQSVHQLFAQEAQEMEFSLVIQQDPVLVMADKDQLMRVFNNLYKNAIQAIPAERRGNIQSHLSLTTTQVTVVVQDNGTGIPEETREKVFVPNFTTKSSGTGLGLAMSRSIIESFGGHIYFETEEGSGTRFFVELPLSKA